MKLSRMVGVLLVITSLAPVMTRAESDAGDKSGYTLFNPTPRDEMREWKTDRPGVSPFTVDAGHVELDVFAVAYERFSEKFGFFERVTTEQWTYGSTLLKLGLLNRLDLELGIDPYIQTIRNTTFIIPGVLRLQGTSKDGRFGDTSARLKWNLWGDDQGRTALSLSGFASFPTESPKSSDDGYAGGPALEFAAQLPWSFELRIDSQAILFKDFRSDLQQKYINLISLNRQIVGPLHGYAMFSSLVQTGPDTFVAVPIEGGVFIRQADDWDGYASTGLYYRIRNWGEIFAGCSFGVHGEAAADYAPFVGFAVRY